MSKVNKIIGDIEAGVNEYEADLKIINNAELWELCFGDGDFRETDTCVIEMKKRLGIIADPAYKCVKEERGKTKCTNQCKGCARHEG